MKTKIRFIAVFFIAILFAGCSPQLVNLDIAKSRVEHYYESGQYISDVKKIVRKATNEINNLKLAKKDVVIFDIDDTSISNYQHSKKIGFGFYRKEWNNWVLKAKAPAILPVLKFYKYLLSKKINIVFLTGRNQKFYNVTLRNLRQQGYTKFDTVICRNKQELRLTAAKYKEIERQKIAKKGYKIIASIGDQWSDLAGGYTGIRIKLPNYYYFVK